MTTSSGVYIRKLVVTGALGALAIFLGITRLVFSPGSRAHRSPFSISRQLLALSWKAPLLAQVSAQFLEHLASFKQARLLPLP